MNLKRLILYINILHIIIEKVNELNKMKQVLMIYKQENMIPII